MVEGDQRLLFGKNTYELGGRFRLPGWNWVNEGSGDMDQGNPDSFDPSRVVMIGSLWIEPRGECDGTLGTICSEVSSG